MNRLVGLLLMTMLLFALTYGDARARGFGGFRGGGGGFGGERFGGRFDSDGFGGGFGQSRFGGEYRSYGSDDVYRRQSYGGGYGRSRYEGDGSREQAYRSEDGRRYSGESWRQRSTSDANRNAYRQDATRSDLNKFLGLPTDAGLGHLGPTGADTRYERPPVPAGTVTGPIGLPSGYVSGAHIAYVPPDVRNAQAWTVRNSNYAQNLFTPTWYKNHPNAWIPPRIRASAWAPATWFDVSDWVGCESLPDEYDYGSTVVYQGDTVYVEGQSIGSPIDYYNQATSLAVSGDASQDDQSQWMPLGVFAMVQGTQTDPTMTFQLAVNRQGVIRGTCFNTVTNTSLPVHGAVDKKTQRVAWTVGDNKSTVFDTGLYNLTKDQAPALVHYGKERTQEWLLVRLEGKSQTANGS